MLILPYAWDYNKFNATLSAGTRRGYNHPVMSKARKHAIRALSDILGGTKPKDAMENSTLDSRDRAFEMELLYGVLRHMATLDWIAGKFLKKPGHLHETTLGNIRLALYQAFHTRVPEWAAVNEAVDLEHHQKKLVNAVLRNAIRQKAEIAIELCSMRSALEDTEVDETKAIRTISLLESHPEWLIRRWVRRFGIKEASALASANNAHPPLTLRVNTLKTSRDGLLAQLKTMGIEARPATHSPDGIVINGEIPLSAIKELMGMALVQDEGAQIVSYLLKPKPGEIILDACAAPGGKATHIAQLIGDKGQVVAIDRDTVRMKRLSENAAALGISSITPFIGNLEDYISQAEPESFDSILLDAPCSALGVIRRNPDVRYRHKESDLAGFGAKQLSMLRSVSGMLRPEGRLVYATCSTEPEEGEDVIKEFLKTAPEYFMIEDGFADGLFTSIGMMRTYPNMHGMDGFFGAVMGKKNITP